MIPRETAIQVEGLWLQGCDFDGKRMIDVRDQGNTKELVSLPVCYLGWISQNDKEPYAEGVVSTPIYHTLNREKMLCSLNLPNMGDEASRVIGGVALFLNGSE
jgi:hypothetical protein